MPTFAVIAEGITDQVTLDAILNGYYRDKLDDDVDINPLQPRRDETDRARVAEDAFGGWELVLEYCADHDRIREALALNDYLVIQIDTDCGDRPNYDVPLTINGQDKPVGELVQSVKDKLIRVLGEGLFEAHQDRILFAICVHSLECWLIPLHEVTNSIRKRTKSCETHLQTAVRRGGGVFRKDYDIYYDISRGYRKKGAIARCVEACESLAIFINTLPLLTEGDQ